MLTTQFFVLSSNGSTRRLRSLVVMEPALAGCQPMVNLAVNRGLAGCCYFLPSGQIDSAQMRLFPIASQMRSSPGGTGFGSNGGAWILSGRGGGWGSISPVSRSGCNACSAINVAGSVSRCCWLQWRPSVWGGRCCATPQRACSRLISRCICLLGLACGPYPVKVLASSAGERRVFILITPICC